jgi:putative ABC transport system permease protein
MNLKETLTMAANTLVANKLRSSLTMLGIIIGNASVIAMIGVGQGAQKLAAEQFESLGPNVLFVLPGSRSTRRTSFDLPQTLIWEDAKAIEEQVPSAKGVAAQITSNQVITSGNKNTNRGIIGTTTAYPFVRSFELDRGRFFTDVDVDRNTRVAVLGAAVAEELFGQGDNPIGKQIRIKNVSFEVIGVMKPKGSFLGTNQDDFTFIPLTTMSNQIVGRRRTRFGTRISSISVAVDSDENIRAAKFQIENLLRLRHKIKNEDDFGVESQKDVLSIVNNVSSGLTLMLAAIAGISLFVGGIGVMNIMLVSVTERTQEIGLRKAIGAKEENILTQFLIEAVILSATGGIIGTLVGVGGIVLVSTFTPLAAGVSPTAIVLAVSVSGGIGLFFGVFPAKRAAKLDPIVALRSI